MPDEITAALIGAGAALLAAAIPLARNALAERGARHLSPRRQALLGGWAGQGKDDYIENPAQAPLSFTCSMTFTSIGRLVRANSTILATSGDSDALSLSGAFYDNDYLQLSYPNRNLARKQLGVVVLWLAPDGNNLHGYYAGFSPRRSTIVAGKIALRKST